MISNFRLAVKYNNTYHSLYVKVVNKALRVIRVLIS
jgi:hypothetical protein